MTNDRDDVWILGGTGRSGRAIAADLTARGRQVVLVGRDRQRSIAAATAAGMGPDQVLVAADPEAMSAAIRARRPVVVVNTVGPFGTTAGPVVDACLRAGSDYLDLANDVGAVLALLDRDAEATGAGRTLITGSGFGVTATESVVVRLCAGRPPAAEVRVDMIPSLRTEEGTVGEALAATVLDGLPGVPGGRRYQGRRYRDGVLAPTAMAGDPRRLLTPDGDRVSTATMPLGELVAAQRASGAGSVVSASAALPAGRAARTGLRLGTGLLAWAPLRRLAGRRLAAVRFRAKPQPRPHSWGHAEIRWADGGVASGWVRLGEAQDFTVAVSAELADRLIAGAPRAGAFTPAALFGTELIESCGGRFVVDEPDAG